MTRISKPLTTSLVWWWSRQPEKTRSLPLYLRGVVHGFLRYGTRQAAALAYYAIFSIFPLSLLLAVVISRVLGPVVAQQQIQLGLSNFLPSSVSSIFDVVETNVTTALAQSQSFGLIAIVGLTWSGLGLFSNITTSLDHIFRVPESRSIWRQRLIAIIMTLILIALVGASFVTSAAQRLLNALLLERPSVWITIGVYFLPFALNMVIFALLFRYVPARAVKWDAVWPAAIVGALGWELAKSSFGWYLNNVANYQFVYGSIATVIVLLFWAYLVAAIFLFSAELCARLNDWLEMSEQDEADENASTALTQLPGVGH
ncbi:MAG: YihY/virulence factor BrkB family protein [Anaerolineae bacterium]|nr:YihY/virulence factor BrkB family protein [Anaerolineae bacterium]